MVPKVRPKRAWTLLRETLELWLGKNAFQLAGSIAFFTLFSLAPLMIILVTVAGIVLGEEAARGELTGQIEALVGTQAAQAVETAVEQSRLEESGLLPTLLGVGALLFGATTVFAQVQAALNHLWDVKSRPSRSGFRDFVWTRVRSLGLVLILGFLLLVSFVLTLAVTAVVQYASEWVPVPDVLAWLADLALSLTVVTLLFALTFKTLPDVHLGWSDMWRGALLSAALFAVGQYGISFYLTETAPGSAYGTAGSLVILLMWVYYSSLILLFGAAFTRISVRARGGVIEPRSIAVRVRTEIVDEEAGGERSVEA
jgi:membrane protein